MWLRQISSDCLSLIRALQVMKMTLSCFIWAGNSLVISGGITTAPSRSKVSDGGEVMEEAVSGVACSSSNTENLLFYDVLL